MTETTGPDDVTQDASEGVEGHIYKIPAVPAEETEDGDVDGHILKIPAVPADEDEDGDVEGHILKI